MNIGGREFPILAVHQNNQYVNVLAEKKLQEK
jgi:hypothetical protein